MDPLLQRGIAAHRSGNREEARRIFHNSHRTRRKGVNTLTAGVLAAYLVLILCAGLLAVSTQFIRYAPGSLPAATQAITDPPPSATAVNSTSTEPVIASPTVAPTETVLPAPTGTLLSTATTPPTYAPASYLDNRLEAASWRNWPVIPDISLHAAVLLQSAAKNPALDPHAFSKVGDCQMTAGTFLAGYVNGQYSVPDGMQETVKWFSGSMLADDITAVNGYGINTVLDPAYGFSAGHEQCALDETPLECELRTRRPSVVLIGMGTNWIPNGEASFDRYLREIIDTVLATGALPILATKADNVEGDWKLNQTIAQAAYDYDLPLVNVWLSVQKLPNHGLEQPPRQVYLTGDGWMKRNHAWLLTLDKVRRVLQQ